MQNDSWCNQKNSNRGNFNFGFESQFAKFREFCKRYDKVKALLFPSFEFLDLQFLPGAKKFAAVVSAFWKWFQKTWQPRKQTTPLLMKHWSVTVNLRTILCCICFNKRKIQNALHGTVSTSKAKILVVTRNHKKKKQFIEQKRKEIRVKESDTLHC